ncbi:MAG: glycosyl hydrolase family 17 [Bacteroidetes bacterium]|nr:glycosyl hydrolase family 17 [Bacteroidota bacterium]
MKKFGFILLSIIFWVNHTTMAQDNTKQITAEFLLGNPNYPAICYGGYRHKTRDIEPTITELKEDLRLMWAMNIRMLRTYNVHYTETAHLLKAITELKSEQPGFEMYLMLGAWMDCQNAWTDQTPNHEAESERNAAEIQEAVRLAQQYPEIVKIISVGNEAMVKWATSYYVQPGVILKWVRHLQELKKQGKLSKSLWITSSDNFASWGGGDSVYHVKDLNNLIREVDYISMHTYPMHDTHYNPVFWGNLPEEKHLDKRAQIDAAMLRARDYAINQYNHVVAYMESLGVHKPVHIGETGWATASNELYGNDDSQATDEYKAAKYYSLMRAWTQQKGISCFYFEAFDEPWKDAQNPMGSENHFGLFNLKSEAKYALWELCDKGVFEGLTRDGKKIKKTFDGDEKLLWEQVLPIRRTLQKQ